MSSSPTSSGKLPFELESILTSSATNPSHAVPSTPSSSNGTVSTASGGMDSIAASSANKGWIASRLDSNPIFSAGFGLMAVGVGLTFLRRSAVQIGTLAQRRLLVSLEISSKDASYLWFLQWMSQQAAKQASLSQKPLRRIGWDLDGLASRLKSHELAVETKYEQRGDGSSSAEFSLVPGPGTHYFRYHKAWFQVKRERATNMLDLNSGAPWETVTLTTLSRDRQLFSSLLTEARSLAQSAQLGRTVIYTAWGTEWRPFGRPRMRRALESVVLDKGVKEGIVGDVEAFMKRGSWYFQRGIPYRRGYLLHGPPGSGKSSFIQALAGSLEYNICVLNLSERGLTDDKLNHLLANAPERSLVLLEDIDAAFSFPTATSMTGEANARTRSTEQGFNANVTFSGLLNALDGVASSTSQRILFLTTNHIDRLDPALIRPGRVDLKIYVSDATSWQVGELYQRFYSKSSEDSEGVEEGTLSEWKEVLMKKVERDVENGTRVSMAAVQGHFIRNGAKEALDGWERLVEEVKEDKEVRLRFASSF
ncbi:mitochondrial chaperone BCS1 [Microbotryum lychnidis-dioicae p1A1 Lamole]|uniref:Mitochondrial chaperone BCS1 n=1 Tax=Microbotryum lychnidis-dioicae (strain p1A1 Lamole / MvSl-1064) TaxID=683840 RepID=U5HEU6_USTV1|nr:mitochondrial chaperone BCS1 [Microbotryum lychnidis-dioicae p1A1 Lamole]|eukprot:KDE03881.1 mitochondrial chaperone BCS1 [Microbotryum lychnidis-dioicae p1A1 Lamole]